MFLKLKIEPEQLLQIGRLLSSTSGRSGIRLRQQGSGLIDGKSRSAKLLLKLEIGLKQFLQIGQSICSASDSRGSIGLRQRNRSAKTDEENTARQPCGESLEAVAAHQAG